MEPFPLKYLSIYKVLQDFTSDPGHDNPDLFTAEQRIQYIKTISNIHGMMEIIHFKDVVSGKELIWNTRVENLYDNWREYLLIDNKK